MNTALELRSRQANDLIDFIDRSPTAYHTVNSLKNALLSEGFTELSEQQPWMLAQGGKYFVIRNGSSLLAFTLPQEGIEWNGFRVVAAHNDSPALKLKDIFDSSGNGYCRLNVEKYGGMICSTWMDRPLSIAGRVFVETDAGVKGHLVDQKCPTALIPSVAIHMERNVNDGKKFNAQVDMLPIVGMKSEKTSGALLSDILPDDGELLSHDLYVYVSEKGYLWGADEEMISAPRLDDLMAVCGALTAFLQSAQQPHSHVNMLAAFDNEEIGSQTLQGAASSFLEDTVCRINDFHGNIVGDPAAAYAQLSKSLMLSADNAHAVHPNHPEYADAQNRPVIGGGLAVKFNAQQRYATDAIGTAIFRKICRLADIQLQGYANRSDMPGGSTLGNIAQTRIPIRTIDIGIPQLAMHSAFETAGSGDYMEYIRACTAFYCAKITCNGEDAFSVEV